MPELAGFQHRADVVGVERPANGDLVGIQKSNISKHDIQSLRAGKVDGPEVPGEDDIRETIKQRRHRSVERPLLHTARQGPAPGVPARERVLRPRRARVASERFRRKAPPREPRTATIPNQRRTSPNHQGNFSGLVLLGCVEAD